MTTKGRPKIVFNDFPGHPIFADLSRTLAAHGTRVAHVHCATMDSPHGDFADTAACRFVPIPIGQQFPKHRPARRLVAELLYGWKSARAVWRHRPDLVVANQMPVISLWLMQRLCPSTPLVVWMQDIQSGLAGIAPVARARLIGRALAAVERRVADDADQLMVISEAMLRSPVLDGIDDVDVVPDWGPIGHIGLEPRRNDWARLHGLADVPTVVYSGTLGIKHDADFLLDLARSARHDGLDIRVVVVSSGPSWERLARTAATERLDTLVCLPLQGYDVLPQVLATADVLVASLLGETGNFAVPSKVHSYLCAGRPVAGLMPTDNPAARLINDEACAGLASPDRDEVARFIFELLDDPDERDRLGARARKHADEHFDIDEIALDLLRRWSDLVEGGLL